MSCLKRWNCLGAGARRRGLRRAARRARARAADKSFGCCFIVIHLQVTELDLIFNFIKAYYIVDEASNKTPCPFSSGSGAALRRCGAAARARARRAPFRLPHHSSNRDLKLL